MNIATKLLLVPLLFVAALSVQAKDIAPDDFSNLLAEQKKNALRFEKTYNGSNFSGKGKFDDVSKSSSYPDSLYIVNFKAGKIEIVCGVSDKKTLDFVAGLDKGQVVQINATFQKHSLSDDRYTSGFMFHGCKLSK